MAITVTDTSLSTNARYVVYSGSTAANDAQTLLLKINDALVNLGWTKYDNAGAAAVLGTADDAKVIMRRTTNDNASSGHYSYLSLRMHHVASTYNFYLTYSSGHTGNTTYGNWINPVYSRSTVFSNASGVLVNPSFTGGGTIWLFEEGNSLVMKFTGTGFTEGEPKSVLYFGEYDKIFGEACDASTGYIHNGVAIDGNELVEGVGAQYYNGPIQEFSTGQNTSNSYYSNSRTRNWLNGTDNTQFALTEYPQTVAGITDSYNYLRHGQAGFDVPIGSTSANDGTYSYYTRMHLGWLGWVGHIAPSYRTSLSAIISAQDHGGAPQQSHFISGIWGYQTALTKASQQFLPNPSSNQIALYEPVISSGTMNAQRVSTSQHTYYASLQTMTAKKVFAVHGKLLGFRMSLGQPAISSGGYQFLDTGTIPLDASGYYNASGTPTACWAIPLWSQSGTPSSSVCIWVKK